MDDAMRTESALRAELEGRRAAYAFLSAAYASEVTLGFLELMRAQPPALEGEMGAFAASLQDADLEQVRVDLAAEYARTFLGMSRSPVAPYESVYASDLHILMQEPRDEVVQAYRSEGFAVAENIGLPEDHLAFELEFMERLCRKAVEALDEGRAGDVDRLLEAQRAFFRSHIATWVPALCDDVRRRVRTPFYRGLVELTEQLLEAERDFLLADAN